MHICHVYKDYYPPVFGGIEKFISLIAKYQREFVKVSVLVCGGRVRSRVRDIDGIEVIYAGEIIRILRTPLSPQLYSYVKHIKPDIFIVHTPNPMGELAVCFNRVKVPYIIRYHSDVVRQKIAMLLYAPLFNKVLKDSRYIIPTSEIYQKTSPVLKKYADKCIVVPLGIEVDYYFTVNKERVKELTNQYGEDFIFFCGVHRYYKGLHVLLESAKELDVPVVIAGEGPETKKLLKIRDKTGISNVFFVGAISDEELKAYLHACALFVFPSIARSEAFGISIIEAHTCGKPVIATKLGTGVEWANLDGVTGINVEPGNPKELTKAINFLLKNRKIREEMGKIAQQRVKEIFDITKTAKKEIDIYKMAIGL